MLAALIVILCTRNPDLYAVRTSGQLPLVMLHLNACLEALTGRLP
jgi:hypothetical protein